MMMEPNQTIQPTLERTSATVTFRFTRSKGAMTTVLDSGDNEIVTVSLPATSSTLFARLVVSSL